MSEWISVKMKHPEYTCHAGGTLFTNVLGYSPKLGVGEMLYKNGKFIQFGILNNYVTHWMPLPEPPEGK